MARQKKDHFFRGLLSPELSDELDVLILAKSLFAGQSDWVRLSVILEQSVSNRVRAEDDDALAAQEQVVNYEDNDKDDNDADDDSCG